MNRRTGSQERWGHLGWSGLIITHVLEEANITISKSFELLSIVDSWLAFFLSF
jgi:hypothetical protein